MQPMNVSLANNILSVVILATPGVATANSQMETCIMHAFNNAPPSTTLSQLREQCQDNNDELTIVEAPIKPESTIAKRVITELDNRKRDFVMTPHDPNFLLPFTHNAHTNSEPFLETNPEANVDQNEAMIQVSVEFPVAIDVWNTDTDLMVAYTNRAWWQVYNDDFSKPFRETNYEPEVFLRHYNFYSNSKWYVPQMFDIGYNHQSNGRDEPLSRSWDRLFATAYFQLRPDLAMSLRTWYRLPESDGEDEMAGEQRYFGYGDARLVYTHDKHTLSMMVRPGTEHTSLETTWSYPISKHIRIMAYYYNGYGESLLDYDHKTERFGIGFAINDFLTRSK